MLVWLHPRWGSCAGWLVIDVGDGIIELVNPRILRTAGKETTSEGCLSFPGEYGLVERPTEVEIEAQDRHGKFFRMTGHDLLARAFCHETDHLDGKVFKSIATEMLDGRGSVSMRIVFMGTPDFAVPSLQGLIDDGHEILAVYTQPDKPVGRKQVLTPPPVKALALEHGLPVYQPTKMRDGTVAAQLRELAPDLIAVVAYGRILPKEILEIPPYGCINVHGSLLPKYRGAGPDPVVGDQRRNRDRHHYHVYGRGAGHRRYAASAAQPPLAREETAGELFDRLAPMGADCLKKTVRALEEKRITPVKQDEQKATYAPMLDKTMAELDFTRPASELHNLIRGLNPWPVAHTRYGDKKLKIFSARVENGTGEPGTVLDAEQFVIACGEGALRFTEVQLEGAAA